MAILIKDDHLESAVERVKAARGDGSRTKTAKDLLREYLVHLGVLPHASKGEAPPVTQPDAA